MSDPKVGDPFNGGLQALGPRRVRKEGSSYIEERLPPVYQEDDEQVVDELMRGISSNDMRRGSSGFGRFAASQPKQEKRADYGVYPGSHSSPSHLGEDAGSESANKPSGPTPALNIRDTEDRRRHTDEDAEDLLSYSPAERGFPDDQGLVDDDDQTGDDRPLYSEGRKERDILSEVEDLFKE